MCIKHLLVTIAVTQALLANAAPMTDPTPAWVTVHPEATTISEEQAIRDYWTPERIQNIDSDERIENAPPIPEEEQSVGREFPSKGAILPTVGRLLYTHHLTENGTDDSSCTGTLVESANHAVIVTAAHCIHAGESNPFVHGYHTNLLFIPGWRDGEMPFGSFTASHVVLPLDWTETSTYEDRAFVVLNRGEDGRTPGEILGEGQQMRFDSADNFETERWQLGYTRYTSGPDTDPRHGTPAFVGDRLASCNGVGAEWWRFKEHEYGLSGIECRMSGGASGGPHLEKLDLETGRGVVIAVNNIIDGVRAVAENPDRIPAMWGVNVTDARSETLLSVAGGIKLTF